MSLRANIDHLEASGGIEAVAVISAAGPREFRGDESWSALLDGALNLLEKTGEPTIRLVVGKHTIVVQQEKDETVAVVLPTGHAIAKSLRRMIRRMSRKVRPPLRPGEGARPAAASPPGAAAQPQSPTDPASHGWGG